MLSDAKIKSLKIEDGKRHADRDGLVLEIRPSGKKILFKYDLKTQKWISQEKPYEPCGIIALEYFTKDPRTGFNKFGWSYTLQQIITNFQTSNSVQ